VTWREYEKILPQRVAELHRAVHAGAYRATPSRWVYIPKADGRQRPLGIASIEDKIVQQAVVTVLGAIYDVDFSGPRTDSGRDADNTMRWTHSQQESRAER
jgi:RNA-directed DNA polymerase